MQIMFVGSSGGHLAQLLALREWWGEHERSWVTFGTADATEALEGEHAVWGFHPTTRNLPNLLRNTLLAWRELRRQRPDVVMSTGAGLALPFFVFARMRGIKTVYLEVYDRIDSATLTGRLCKRYTDLFLVQWEEQLRNYPKAVVAGPVW